MSNSKLVSYTRISPNSNNPRNSKILKITPHHMAGNMSLESFGNLVANPARQMSANYAIDSNGKIGLFVDEKNRSWCSGSPDNDHQAVTIEVANDGGAPDWHVSDKALASLINLCVDICQRNNIKSLNFTGNASGNLTQHNYFQATACPGPYLKSKFTYIATEVNKKLAPKEEPKPSTGLKVGDEVKIKASASKYATGQFIPDWVKNKTHFIKQISGVKALLGDKNSNGIYSWLFTSDLSKVGGSSSTPSKKVYTVKPGDSFWKIAQEQMGDGNKYKELAKYNGLNVEAVIHPGDQLMIP